MIQQGRANFLKMEALRQLGYRKAISARAGKRRLRVEQMGWPLVVLVILMRFQSILNALSSSELTVRERDRFRSTRGGLSIRYAHGANGRATAISDSRSEVLNHSHNIIGFSTRNICLLLIFPFFL